MNKRWLIAILAGVAVMGGCQAPSSAPTMTSTETAVLLRTLRPRAIEIVRGSLHHENPFIRNNAIEVVAETQQQDMMAEILRLMNDDAVAIRFSAVMAAGDMRCFGCEQEVRKRLRDEDENVQLAAAYSLGKLGAIGFHDRLRQAADHDDQTVRANAALLLGKAGHRDDLDVLYRMMRAEGSDEKARFQAIESIARLKDARLYRSKLWALLISKYADDRVMGIRAMGALGTADAKNALLTMLSDDIIEVRLCAAEQLGRLGDRTGREEVAAYLAQNPDFHQPGFANLMAISAIGRIGTPDLAGYLPKAFDSRSDMIRLTAAHAVLLLTK